MTGTGMPGASWNGGADTASWAGEEARADSGSTCPLSSRTDTYSGISRNTFSLGLGLGENVEAQLTCLHFLLSDAQCPPPRSRSPNSWRSLTPCPLFAFPIACTPLPVWVLLWNHNQNPWSLDESLGSLGWRSCLCVSWSIYFSRWQSLAYKWHPLEGNMCPETHAMLCSSCPPRLIATTTLVVCLASPSHLLEWPLMMSSF